MDDPCCEIRKANDRIGLLTVSEIVTKDVIYLKQDISAWKRYLTMENLGKGALKAVISNSMWGSLVMMADPKCLQYEMDPGTGVVWGHQGVIEYVIDLSQAQVELEGRLFSKQRQRVKVTIPKPYVDPESMRLNLETFGPILKNKRFKDGDEVVVKMEKIAKAGFVGGLRDIANSQEYITEACVAAKTALKVVYTSAAKGVEVEVQFK